MMLHCMARRWLTLANMECNGWTWHYMYCHTTDKVSQYAMICMSWAHACVMHHAYPVYGMSDHAHDMHANLIASAVTIHCMDQPCMRYGVEICRKIHKYCKNLNIRVAASADDQPATQAVKAWNYHIPWVSSAYLTRLMATCVKKKCCKL